MLEVFYEIHSYALVMSVYPTDTLTVKQSLLHTQKIFNQRQRNILKGLEVSYACSFEFRVTVHYLNKNFKLDFLLLNP